MESRIDIERLEWMIFSALRRIHRSMDSHSRDLEREHGLTLPQLDILVALAESGREPIGRVAQKVHLSKATLTSIADRLVDHGLLHRQRSVNDKRQVELWLTDKAREIVERGPHPFHTGFSAQLESLDHWQQTQLLSSIQRIASMVEPEAAPAATFEE